MNSLLFCKTVHQYHFDIFLYIIFILTLSTALTIFGNVLSEHNLVYHYVISATDLLQLTGRPLLTTFRPKPGENVPECTKLARKSKRRRD